MSDIHQYGLAFLYDPRYHAEDPVEALDPLPWYKRIRLNWLLDAVLRLEGRRFDHGGPYTHTLLSKFPQVVDVRLGSGGGKAYAGDFSDADRRRGLDVYPHSDQEIMCHVFSEVARRVDDGTETDYWFSVPSLLWLMVIGYLAEGRFTWLMRVLVNVIPDLPGVFCSEMVADALRRFSSKPFCVYVEEERVRNLQLSMSRRAFLKRIQKANELWDAGEEGSTEEVSIPELAWMNFQSLDMQQVARIESPCPGESQDEQGRVLVPIGHDEGQISPHLVGLSDLANSPNLSAPIGFPRIP